jgi:hypothetical protein
MHCSITSFKTSDSNFKVLAHSVLEQLFEDKNAVSFEAMSATSAGTKVTKIFLNRFLIKNLMIFFQDPLGCKQIFFLLLLKTNCNWLLLFQQKLPSWLQMRLHFCQITIQVQKGQEH